MKDKISVGYLMVLQFSADYPERVVDLVLEDVNFGEPRRCATGDPLLLDVVVDHHRGPRTRYALLAETTQHHHY